MNNTVIYHSADYDGIFCREIAHKFIPNAELIGWDYGQPKIPVPLEGLIYILDLSPECLDAPYGKLLPSILDRVIWIDHHKTAIEKFPNTIRGYRIDGVAACRLTWLYFGAALRFIEQTVGDPDWAWFQANYPFPTKEVFIHRKLDEPLAIRLAGEYDVWDHRGDGDLEFQFGLDTEIDKNPEMFKWLLGDENGIYAKQIIAQGSCAMECYRRRDSEIVKSRSFIVNFEGFKFLALNTARCNSNSFAGRDLPETGHDGLMGFWFNGSKWTVSLYHASHRRDIDLSQIAVKHGGGGHRGACGFMCDKLPFL